MSDSDPKPEPTLFASDLPSELIAKILNYQDIGIREKRKGRLISPVWRNVIDARPEIVFNVKLNNKSAKWVQNTNVRIIHTLSVTRLTIADFDYKMFQTKPKEIVKVIIGSNNSGDHFRKILQLCDEQSVECLKFEEHSIPVQEKDSNRLRITLPSVKTLEMEIEYFKKDITEPAAICNFLDELSLPCLHHLDFKFGEPGFSFLDYDFQKNRILTAFYKFLNRHNTVLRLELSIFEKFTTDKFSLLPAMDSSMSLRNIEELSIHLDFRTHRQVSPLIQHCKALKALTIYQLQSSQRNYYNPETVSELDALISQNVTTLESISLKSSYILYSKIGLEACTRLRILKLDTNDFRFDATSRIFPKVQRLEMKYPPHLDFRVIKNFVEFAGAEGEWIRGTNGSRKYCITKLN